MKNLLVALSVALFSLLLLGGCGSSNNSDNSVPTISGTAATGKGIVGTVIVKDANGVEVNSVSDSDGRYRVQVPAMTPPFIIQAIPDDGNPTQYSFAASPDQTVNITPLTTESLLMASGNADLESIYASWDGSGIQEENIKTAQQTLLKNLSTQLTDAGLDPEKVDLFSDEFETNGKGLDAVLDQLLVTRGLESSQGELSGAELLPVPIGSDGITIDTGAFNTGTSTFTGGTVNLDTNNPDIQVIEVTNVTNTGTNTGSSLTMGSSSAGAVSIIGEVQ